MVNNSYKYDLIVVGGGPGGLPAAISGARMGLKTLLIERSSLLGGLAVSGLPILGYIDRSGRKVLGGIPQEFINRLEEVDATLGHIRCPVHNSFTMVNPSWFRITAFEMCQEAGVNISLYSELMDVKVDNGKITGITALCRGEVRSFDADIVIDAMGDACVSYLAGARYVKSKNLQPGSLVFTIGNVNIQAFIEYLKKNPQTAILPDTYGVRQNLEQFTDSKGFIFTGFSELIEAAQKNNEFSVPRDRIIFATLPNKGEVMVNTTRILDLDSSSFDSVVAGEVEAHRQIKELMKFFRKYAPGFEECYLAGIAPQVGSRESRKTVGIKTLTMESLTAESIPMDTIALAGYNIDIHVPGTKKLYLQPVEHAIGIPYGCLVSADIEGLMMSGRCISVSDDIYGLTRIMGTCMAIGEAAGTAAAIACKKGVAPSEVDVAELRRTLAEAGAIVE